MEFSWLNCVRSAEASFSDLFAATRAGRLESVRDEKMMQTEPDRGRYVVATRLQRKPGN